MGCIMKMYRDWQVHEIKYMLVKIRNMKSTFFDSSLVMMSF